MAKSAASATTTTTTATTTIDEIFTTSTFAPHDADIHPVGIDEALALIESNSKVLDPEQHDCDLTWVRTWGLAVRYWEIGEPVLRSDSVLRSASEFLRKLIVDNIQLPTSLDEYDEEPQIILQKKNDHYILLVRISLGNHIGDAGPGKTIDENSARQILNMVKDKGYLLFDLDYNHYRLV